MVKRMRYGRVGETHQAASRDRWLISYADFVTLLFAVFVVLFAFSWQKKQQSMKSMSSAIHEGFNSLRASPSEEKESSDSSLSTTPPASAAPTAPVAAKIGSEAARLDTDDLARQLKGILGDSISKHEIVMQQTPDGLVISLRELGFFDSGGSNLLPGAAEKLKNTAKVLMDRGMELRVEGHSDDQPIHNAAFHSNWELSTARAMSVLTLLVDQGGFPATKISVAGYGPYRPVADNSTPEGRRTNRRVDLVVISPHSIVAAKP
jgi:chemotaxis protein MotB